MLELRVRLPATTQSHLACCVGPRKVREGLASASRQSPCQRLRLRDESVKRHFPSGHEKREKKDGAEPFFALCRCTVEVAEQVITAVSMF